MPRRQPFMVKDLVALLLKCDQNAIPVMSGSDHSYQRVGRATEVDAELNEYELFEYYSDEHMIDDTSTKVTAVLIEM